MLTSKKFNRFATVFLAVLVCLTVFPVLLILMASFTDENTLLREGYSLFPSKFSTGAYYYIIQQGAMIFRAYGVTVFATLAGTVVSVLLTTMLAYPMSRKSFRYRNALSFFVFFTMLFNGGIVPSYIIWTRLFHIKNTIFALILPNYLVGAMNVILVKNYYANNVPDALVEAAQIDGAKELQIFWKIMFPLAKPVVATIALFTGLTYWNDWTNGLYYIDDAKLYSVQLLLMKIMNNVDMLKSNVSLSGAGEALAQVPGTSVRMAIAVIGVLPIMVLYPFVQKYLIKGVVVGAVKG